jgi:hypothetical protein
LVKDFIMVEKQRQTNRGCTPCHFKESHVEMEILREKARMPRAVHGDEWPWGLGGIAPNSN